MKRKKHLQLVSSQSDSPGRPPKVKHPVHSEIELEFPANFDQQSLLRANAGDLGFQQLIIFEHPENGFKYVNLSKTANTGITTANRLAQYFWLSGNIRQKIKDLYSPEMLDFAVLNAPWTIKLPFPGSYDINEWPGKLTDLPDHRSLIKRGKRSIEVTEHQLVLSISGNTPTELTGSINSCVQILLKPAFLKILK